MTDPQLDKLIKMFNTITDKHVGQMNWIQVYYTVEDSYVGGSMNLVQTLVPHLDINFKH